MRNVNIICWILTALWAVAALHMAHTERAFGAMFFGFLTLISMMLALLTIEYLLPHKKEQEFEDLYQKAVRIQENRKSLKLIKRRDNGKL